MASPSPVSANMRDTANETRESVREIGQAAAEASANAQSDLQSLRDDFSRLAEQVADILANRGNAAWQRAKVSVDNAVSGAQETGQDAADALREVSDHFVEAVDESIRTRPYTTLAIAAGLGFLFGMAWRR
jgi:ElaB/YqjD/DUF883 family membrane-anchored ribosome-binding protein